MQKNFSYDQKNVYDMNYFIIVNDAQQGPYTIEELRQRHIDTSTLVWAEGMAQWTPAWQVEELKTLFNGATDNGANATTRTLIKVNSYQG